MVRYHFQYLEPPGGRWVGAKRQLKRLARLVTGIGWLLLHGPTIAQEFPNKPLRMIVPFAAGGATDIVGRTVGQQLSEAINRSVIIDNRPGAGGVLGTDIAAKSAPDGYTLLLCSTGPITISPSLVRKMPYDASRDFAPVTSVASIPYLLVVGPTSKAQSVKQLISMAKGNPGQLNFGSAGNGSTSHLAGELFKSMAQIDVAHIPYKGSALAMTDLISGQLHMYFDAVASALPLVRGGKLRALGIAGKNRFAALPDVPTVGEAGLPGYEVSSWYGICLPAGTPTQIVSLLNRHVIDSITNSRTKERLAGVGAEVITDTPEEFRKFIQNEREQWSRVIRNSGVGDSRAN